MIFQQCQSTVGWQPASIPSSSQEGKAYVVHVNPWKNDDEHICECPGYVYHGKCRHQKEAADKICGWHQLVSPEEQDADQWRIGLCPRCGGPTLRQVVEDDADD